MYRTLQAMSGCDGCDMQAFGRFFTLLLTVMDKMLGLLMSPHSHVCRVLSAGLHLLPPLLQLVFFESNQLARAALYYYLRRLGLAVEVKTSLVYAQDCLLSNNITSNTPADWVDRGMNLLQQQVRQSCCGHGMVAPWYPLGWSVCCKLAWVVACLLGVCMLLG